MIRTFLVGVVFVVVWSSSARASMLQTVELSPEGELLTSFLVPPGPGIPGLVAYSALSTEPTVHTFTKDPEALSVDLSFQIINLTGFDLNEYRVDFTGGALGESEGLIIPPLPDPAIITLESSNRLSVTQADGVGLGDVVLATFRIDFPEGTAASLTVTPLVPEPAAGVLLLAALPAARRRGESATPARK